RRAAVGGEEVTGQRCALVRDRDRFNGGSEEYRGLSKRISLPLESVHEARVKRRAVEEDHRAAEVRRGAQKCLARTDGVPGRAAGHPEVVDALAGAIPLGVPGVFIALGNAARGGKAFPHVGAIEVDRVERAQELALEL